MTTYEHAMLGVTGTLAAGLNHRYGWQIVALGGFVAILPDWDGLSILFGAPVFDRFHRTLGHNLLVCVLLGAAVAVLDYRFDLASRVKGFAGRRLRLFASDAASPQREAFRADALTVWIITGVLASLSHLAADLVFSGHAGFSDWGLRLCWPFSDRAWAFPMVSWGDPGVTLIFAAGMFAMIRWPARLQRISAITLALVLAYVGIRAAIAG